MKWITNISRVLVGLLFIISGLIKANDPIGFGYKLEEYFTVFHMTALIPLALYKAIAICILEVVLGIQLLIGARMKLTSWLLMILIVFFTFLTFYSAYFNKVSDCGCFGDALHLTPWQSFTKDIVLLILITIVFIGQKHIKPLFARKAENVVVVFSILLCTAFPIYTYNFMPVIDFRPYKIGTNILKAMEIPVGAPQSVYKTVLTYEKNGVAKEFTTDNYPWNDSTWVWKDTKNVLVTKGYVPPIHDFNIVDQNATSFTQEFMNAKGYSFILVSYDLNKINRDVLPKVNEFAEACEKAGIKFYGLTSNGAEETDIFRHDVNAMYPFYFCDMTQLKTIIRANPGLVMIKDGVVMGMWHYHTFPNFDAVKAQQGF